MTKVKATWIGVALFAFMPASARPAGGAPETVPAQDRVADRLWVWGHAKGVYNGNHLANHPKKSEAEPVQAALDLGVRNIMFVRYDGKPEPPFDAYYAPFKALDKVVWSLSGMGGATSPEEREAVLSLARSEGNLAGFILDDFFKEGDRGGEPNPYPLNATLAPWDLRELREQVRVRGKGLPLLAVVYTDQISPRALPYMDALDGVTLWTWKPEELADLEANFEKLEALVPGMPLYLGCYMFDFDANKPLSVDQMKHQTELGLKWLKEGRLEGIILLGTPVADVDLEAVAWTRDWIRREGDTRVPKAKPPAPRPERYAEPLEGKVSVEVEPGSPAAEAGMLTGDRVARCNGREIRSVHDLFRLTRELKEGDRFRFEVLRGDETLRFDLAMGHLGLGLVQR